MSIYVLSYSKEFQLYLFTTADVFHMTAGIGVVLHCLQNTFRPSQICSQLDFFVIIELSINLI